MTAGAIGLVKKYENVGELATDAGISEEVLRATFSEYNEISSGNKEDPFGKSHGFSHFDEDSAIYGALITPVVHYTMGGLAIDSRARILDMEMTPIHGLFGAGEVTGGVHGKNRLAGNSLLECVVFGQRAANTAIRYCEGVQKEFAKIDL